jgi:hypothetical protein
MIWLVIALLVSLAALLIAAAGLARHIWLHHWKLRRKLAPSAGAAIEPADEIEADLER